MGKNFLLQWEWVVRCYPGSVGLPVAVVGWVSTLMATTQKLAGLIVTTCDISYLGIKQLMMGKWVC